jgi:conjugative relaxase-like TrwC/TraI family protein
VLTISKPLSASQAQAYHAQEFTSAEQAYYNKDGIVRGEWQGRLADEWRLRGEVREKQFEKLAQGYHPQTGEALVRHQSAREYTNEVGDTVQTIEHRAGWDATFSAPKSVSLTALVGGDERVREAHRASVRVALDELERYVQARIGNNHEPETTGKWIVAKFEHDSARPVNGYAAPQLHTHSVFFNVTETEGGSTRALQPQELYRSQRYATAIYQAELGYRIQQLGYGIETGKNGAPEIQGYSKEYLEASSPRSQQIKDHLEERGLSGAGAAQIAAHRTRDAKVALTAAEMLARHRELAVQFGNQADRIVAEARERGHRKEPQSQEESAMRAQEAMTYARDKNLEREAVADERDLIRDAVKRASGQATYRDVRANFETRRRSGEFLEMPAMKGSAAHRFTTPGMREYEREVIRYLESGKGSVRPILNQGQAELIDEKWPHLNPSQRTAVKEVLTSSDRVIGIQGAAGAGKTTSLSAIREAAELAGYAVRGFAPTSRAAQQLAESGISSATLQSYLARSAQAHDGIPRLYFVDEASLASTRQVHEFLSRLPASDRVVFVGDIRQHQGVEAGRPFEQLQEAGMHTARLDWIVRQQDPGLREAVEMLSQGDVREAVGRLAEQGRVTEIPNREERMAAIARDYADSPQGTLVVSPDNLSRRELNKQIRGELQERGTVGRQDYVLDVLIPRQDLTGAERQWAERYHVGDTIRYTRGSTAVGIDGGEYACVVGIDREENLLTVERADGQEVTYDPRRLHGVSVYREEERALSVDDRVQFTAPDREQNIANRTLGTIEGITENGDLTIKLDSGRSVEVSAESHHHINHGYAVTSHSSQGVTCDRVLVDVDTEQTHDNLINSRLAYVAVSRARHDAHIYTNDAEHLGEELSREVSKSAAVDATDHGQEHGESIGPAAAPGPTHDFGVEA